MGNLTMRNLSNAKRNWMRTGISYDDDQAISQWAEKRAFKDALAEGRLSSLGDIDGIYRHGPWIAARQQFYYYRELERMHVQRNANTEQQERSKLQSANL